MSQSTSPKPRSSLSKANIGVASILGDPLLLQDPKLIQIANQLANWKCWKAMQDGQIQIVSRRRSPGKMPIKSPVFIPRADIVDDPASPTVDAIFELPGLKSDEIGVTLKDGYLVVHGVRHATYKDPLSGPAEDSSLHSVDIDPLNTVVRELRYGAFHRRIKLPDGTKESDISAKLAEGMLKITWPRSLGANDSDSSVKAEASSPMSSRATSASPEPVEGKATAGTALQ